MVYMAAVVIPQGGRVSFVSRSHPKIKYTRNDATEMPDPLLL